jgi:hypothetical protein
MILFSLSLSLGATVFQDDFDRANLGSDWDVLQTPGNTQVNINNNRLYLTTGTSTCSEPIVREVALGQQFGDLTFSFDWEGYYDGWYEYPEYAVYVDGSEVHEGRIDTTDYGSTTGSTEFTESVNGDAHLRFRIDPSGSCGAGDHDETAAWFDNLEISSTNSAPNNPANPNPSDTQDTVGLSPNLEVDVSDPDGDSMDVTFYDASDDSIIGTDNSVASGGTATVQASGFDQTGTTYNWYAVADDGSTTTQSSTWIFTTEGEPNIDEASASPQGGSVVSTTPDLSVDVSHPDGRTMDVTFFLNGEAFGTDQQVDGSGTASIQTPDLNASEIYDWYVVVDDRNGYTVDNSGSPWSFETDSGEPNISVDYGNSTNFNPDRAVIDVVPGHSHAGTVDYVRLLDGSSTVIDEVQNVQVGQPVSLLWEELNEDQSYDFRAEIEQQGETSQTSLMSFTTLTVGINLAGSVNNAESYSIYRRKGTSGDQASFDYGDGDYRFIGSSSSLTLTDATSDLEAGDYCYVATASNVGGESPSSTEACITGVQVNP